MSLKNDIERELGTPVRIRAGAPGSLNVMADGQKIFSLKQTGQSPNSDEIIRLIREKTAAGRT